MSGPLLHARCHRLAGVGAVATAGALAVAAVPADRLATALTALLTLAATAAAAGLAPPDADLDLAAARPRPPRRAGQLVGLAVGAVGLCWLLDLAHGSPVPVALLARNAAGQLGLLGIGVVLFGGALGWLLPFAAAAVALLPGIGDAPVTGWLGQPADSAPAALTATAAAVIGLAAYAAWGAHARG